MRALRIERMMKPAANVNHDDAKLIITPLMRRDEASLRGEHSINVAGGTGNDVF
ncbi:MAG TPA: hypothetical protein VNS22_10340 [Geminicoccus sp.]|uniref:hypothetical protein n=1 Tax=Geminicoccus sp. TaxID=2024832 RepID=UPI002C3CED90|nr:hypothetical protein [Geminicoccus sp.]HWL68768.1 hypothetical protein [Geminicoccus sp.]